ncbi:MAG: helix-turn-helix transcriptional regulator [Phycisphaerae bacterium]|jgi:transcriptional regulator with XRE-family HTH domain
MGLYTSGMSPKAQHSLAYRKIPVFLRSLRESAGLTQRQLGEKLGKPQSWIYNCETANRRVDMAEFSQWSKACGKDPVKAFEELLESY